MVRHPSFRITFGLALIAGCFAPVSDEVCETSAQCNAGSQCVEHHCRSVFPGPDTSVDAGRGGAGGEAGGGGSNGMGGDAGVSGWRWETPLPNGNPLSRLWTGGPNEVWAVGDFLHRITEPALRPIRNILPSFGNMDLSPIVLIFAIYALQAILARIYSAIAFGNVQGLVL